MTKKWLLAGAFCAVILAGPALGHAKLQSTIPAADAQLQIAPTSLTLTFNEAVQLAMLIVTADGKNIPVTVDRSAAAAARVSVALPALAAGRYQVQWSVLAVDDGHVSKGTFSFAIVGPASASMTAAPAPVAAPAR
jgi:methionine-rich copper-binding protein CopC